MWEGGSKGIQTARDYGTCSLQVLLDRDFPPGQGRCLIYLCFPHPHLEHGRCDVVSEEVYM